MPPGKFQFAAFLSYSRQDKPLALWLVRALEELHLPREAAAELLARKSAFTAVRPVFRDESDMPVGGAIPTRLAEVLDASAAMIVLVTPASAQSAWVNEEIARFAERHPGRPIIPAVAEGDPDRSETYPPALMKLGKPLAADLRVREERWQAVVKIAAAILGLDVDRLVGRIAKRRAERRMWITAGAGVAGAAFAALGYTAWQTSTQASEATDRGRETVEVALTETRKKLDAAGTLATKAAVLEIAEKYFDGRKPGDLTEEDLRQKAEMLVQKGEDARERGDEEEALRVRQAAFAITEELLSRRRDDPDRLFDHGQKAFYVLEMHWRRGEFEEARRFSEIYWAASQRLHEVKPDYPGAAVELGSAKVNLGVLDVEEFRDPRGAALLFAEGVEEISPFATDIPTKRTLNLAHAYHVQTLAQFDTAERTLAAAKGWDVVLQELDKARASNVNLNFPVARDLGLLGGLELSGGRLAEGNSHRAKSRTIAQQELTRDPDNKRWLEYSAKLELKLAGASCSKDDASKFDPGDAVQIYRMQSCLEQGSTDAQVACAKFASWLPAQKPDFEAEPVWAALLGVCSRDPGVARDAALSGTLDSITADRFFSGEPYGYSLSTQIELSQFRSAGRNTARVLKLREDLQRRGWNGRQG